MYRQCPKDICCRTNSLIDRLIFFMLIAEAMVLGLLRSPKRPNSTAQQSSLRAGLSICSLYIKKKWAVTHQAVHRDLVPDSSIVTVLLHISPLNFVFEIVLIGTGKHRAVMACFRNFFRRRDGTEVLPQTIDFSIKSFGTLVRCRCCLVTLIHSSDADHKEFVSSRHGLMPASDSFVP